jgi:putative PIN family toxin of toxin-antitoxin system
MIKVVPDTNVIVSGFLGQMNNKRKIINLALARKIVMFGSKETYEEFVEKIHMDKFSDYLKRQIYTPEKLLIDYRAFINIVEPNDPIRGTRIVKEDADDDIYFWVAKTAGAKILISSDKKVLNVKRYGDIRVVHPDDFVAYIEKLEATRN